MLLRFGHRLGLGDLRFQATGVQARQQLALVDPIAFLGQNLRNSFVVIERQHYLPEIQVAVKHQLVLVTIGPLRPPPGKSTNHASKSQDCQDQF
jgi:hypothetical protein